MENTNSSLQKSLFLGLDLSTQSLKALVLNEDFKVILLESVVFSKDLPHYNTDNGVFHMETGEKVSPTLMFVEALDLVLEKIKKSSIPIEKITAISGSGQQHGSVFWGKDSEIKLSNIDPSENLMSQFIRNNMFSNEFSPIWMDSTTTKYCRELEEKFGAKNLCEVTGSKAFERFTGNQIKKIFAEKNDMYNKTEHISLISSFLAEIFIGKFASPDFSDASGMNLFDLNKKRWDETLLNFCGGETLASKLRDPVPSYTFLDKISDYFVKRYGFSKECIIIAFSGDNPCSLVGSGILNPGIVGISLGTSDTIFSLVDKTEAKFNFDGHLFVSPTDENQYMMMVCMKNGALVREKIKKLQANDSWEEIEKSLNESNPGNNGICGFFFEYPEISPEINVSNFTLFLDKTGQEININQIAEKEIIRAVFESKAFLLKLALEKFGIRNIEKVIVTGGSSKCFGFLQIISDVFNCEIYKLDNAETAALGAALRAFHGYSCQNNKKVVNMQSVIPFKKEDYSLVAKPQNEAHLAYREVLKQFSEGLEKLVQKYPYNKK